LPRNEIELLFNFIKGQRDMGVGFIYISHFLEEVFELCDSVTILRDGVVVSTESVSGLNLQELIRLISGVKLEHFKRDQMCESDCDLFRLEKINREDMFRDISFTLKEGEIVGITGLEGSGKDVLARSIFGLEKIDSGKMILRDEEYFSENPEEAIGKGISYLPRDRHGLGIVGIRPIRENITLSILKRLLNNLGLIKKSEELKIVNNNVHDLDIAMSSPEQPVEFLSGGNQQKVVFAKLANTQPKVLILEEPTQGVDIQAKTEILKIINNMAKMGVGILFISEEIHELLDICDRILVLYEGEIINEFQMGDVNAIPENILSAIEGEHS